MAENEPTYEALKVAKRLMASSVQHERAAARHDEYAKWLDEKGEHGAAEIERREAMLERDAANDDMARADLIQGATQFTEPKKGDPVEIPIPTREAFLRDLERVAPPVAPQSPADR